MRLARPVSILHYVLLAAMLLAAVLLIVASFVPFATMRAAADSLSPDGSAEMLTAGVHRKTALAMRMVAVALLAGGSTLWWFRRAIRNRLVADLDALGGFGVERSSAVPLVLITGLGAVLRGMFLNQPMGWDESYSYLAFIERPLPVTISAYTDPNNHILHSLLAKLAVLLLGAEPWVIRLPAFLGGVLAIPATYTVGRLLFNGHAGLLAATLVACSAYHIEYSANARGYTLQALFALVCLAIAIAFRGRRNTAAWGAFAVLAALGFWTLPTMLYPFCGILIWLFAAELCSREGGPAKESHSRRRNVLWYLGVACATGVLTVLLYSPALGAVGAEALVANKYVRPLPLQEFWSGLPGLLANTWEHWSRGVPAPISWVLLFGAILALATSVRERPRATVVPVLFAVSVVLIALQRVLPYPRVWLFLLPLFLLQASAGLYWIVDRATRSGRRSILMLALLTVILSGPTAYSVVRQYPALRSPETGVLPDADAIAAFLKDSLRPGERVLAPVPSNTPLQFYFQKRAGTEQSVVANDPDDLPEGRLVVVVNKAASQSLPQVVAEFGIGDADLESARALREYPSAVVYEVPREP